jgi:hypothetical protein
MLTRIPDIFLDIRLRIAVFGFRCSSFAFHPSPPRARRGQTTVEYLLMLAVVVGMTLILAILFHKKILGGMFSLVGMVIGAGKPAP